MKLISYIDQGLTHLGALTDDRVTDLTRAWNAYREQAGGPVGYGAGLADDVTVLLQNDSGALEVLQAVVAWTRSLPDSTRDLAEKLAVSIFL